MNCIRQELRLTYHYSVHFTNGVFDLSNPLLHDVIAETTDAMPVRTIFVADSGVADSHPGLAAAVESYCERYGDALKCAGPVAVIQGGEAAKNRGENLEKVLDAINDGGICRHSFVVAIGGGAVLDVTGYAAAIAHRGVRLIRIPTTVLSQNDGGLGVKNGVNYFGKKNYLGTFAPPIAVINDNRFLATLPDREWLCGTSEAVKVALIKDAHFFGQIERDAAAIVSRQSDAMRHLVRRCAEWHLDHIAGSGDPFELGTSRPLDFGHWAAHKLEHLTAYRLRHGEAVAIGIALDSTYSRLAGLLPERDWRRIIDLLLALKLQIHVPEMSAHADDATHPDSVLRGLTEFREHLGGQLTICLLRSIGQAAEVHEIDTLRMVESIAELKRIAEMQGAGRPEQFVPAALRHEPAPGLRRVC